MNESELTTTRESGGRWRTLSTSPPEKRPRADDDAQPARAAASESSAAEADASIRGAAASEARPHGGETAPEGEAADPDRGTRGLALPGDRGPRRSAADAPRPSFWRRIALGRRARREHDLDPQPTAQAAPGPREAFASSETAVRSPAPTEPPAPTRPTTREPSSAVAPATPSVPAVETIEKRVVEPMLQALVSVEAKLERSHTDLSTRSDHISQRLTQLWEIEEQLGALGEIQESLLQVGEQQRRLESAFLAQTRTLRWLVGAVFFSLVAAAFVVAALLR